VTDSQTYTQTATMRDVDGDGRPAGSPVASGRTGSAPRTGSARGARTRQQPRARILGALTELVGEQGYACSTVADVIARAGASRRTFYEHFANMETCFLTAADATAARWLEQAAGAVEQAADAHEDATEALLRELFTASLDSPGALRLLATDLAATGQAGLERSELVLAALGQTLCEALAADAMDAGEPLTHMSALEQSVLPRALAGAVLRIPYARALRGGRMRRAPRAELMSLIPDLAEWAATYGSMGVPPIATVSQPPPAGGRAPGTLSLSSGANGRRGLSRGDSVSRSFMVHSQRERLLDAVANLSAAKGYDAVTIPEIVQEAGVSVEAFYEHFSGREDTLLVANELGRRKALALMQRAYRSHEQWPEAVRATIAALLGFLASEPSFTRMALIDVPAAGGKLATVHEGALEGLLKDGLGLLPARGRGPAQVSAEASTAAVRELCRGYAAAGRSPELPSLHDVAAHLALAPFALAGMPGC
jgi:AcrR family transcriptional regulator